MIRELQGRVGPHDSLTVDSPACTARAAVCLLLTCGFFGDERLFKCVLAEDRAYMGGQNVQLTFCWRKTAALVDKTEHHLFLQRVARAHPELQAEVIVVGGGRAGGDSSAGW